MRNVCIALVVLAAMCSESQAQNVNVQVNNGRGRVFVPRVFQPRSRVVVNNFGASGFVQPQVLFVQPQFSQPSVFVGSSSFGVRSFGGCR